LAGTHQITWKTPDLTAASTVAVRLRYGHKSPSVAGVTVGWQAFANQATHADAEECRKGASPIPYDIATEVECVNWSGLVSDRVR
jgi:hypothetical protein